MMRKIIFTVLAGVAFVSVHAQTENYWTKKSDFAGMKRERCVAFSIGDIGYLGMGTDTNEVCHNDWWAYDALTDTWTQRAMLPGSVRRNAVGFAIGNKGYVGTGIDSNEAQPGNPLKDFWEYNPASNSWTQKADYPGSGGNGIYFSTAFVLDNKGYIVGGKTGPMNLSDEVWEYKPFNNTWAQRPDFPGGARYQMCSFTVAGKAFVGLGADHNTYQEEFWEYNGGNGMWTAKADFPGGDRAGVVTFTLGERGFVCLGTDGGLKKDLWEYNPYDDDWTARASYDGSERKSAAAFVCYGKAYVGTGDGYSGKKQSMYEYTPVLVLGVNELTGGEFSIVPNPASDAVRISSSSEIESVAVYNVHGELVQTLPGNGNNSMILNCGELNFGIYMIEVLSQQGKVNTRQKLIVQ